MRRPPPAHAALRGGLLAAFLCLTGCQALMVREIEKPAAETTLFTTRAGDQVTLTWSARKGEQYAVMYSTHRGQGSQWKPLPGYERLEATGATMKATDRVPVGQQRYYRLTVVPAARLP